MGHQLTAFVFTCSEHMVNGFQNPNAPNFATLEVDLFYWYLIIHMCSDPPNLQVLLQPFKNYQYTTLQQ